MENSHIDGRSNCALNQWNEYFKIFYLTEKMRSQGDVYFSDLCDRVGRGKVTEEDLNYLNSRVRPCPSETVNEHFKTGRLSIIVTTNSKKNFINHQKLEELLPDKKEFNCNSIDYVSNLPDRDKLPESIKNNPGKTGNLETVLKLKVGAPVVITSNHSKRKYREDGLTNGARGFVHAIQTSNDDPEKVEVVWVIFNDPKVGRLYRADHYLLNEVFNPGHPLATPILPVRKNFKTKFGNVEYIRQNFSLSLAYAITAHKCQGLTLEEVIIDFGADSSLKIRNFIIPGSFYVALTRVKEGNNVYLKSFDPSFIQVNPKLEEKIEAMIKFRSYSFKKIFLDEEIFQKKGKEIKIGYFNINGLLEGNHAAYLNADKNLLNLDYMLLAETKLNSSVSSAIVVKHLSNWNILRRFDAGDDKKHMGLLLLLNKQRIDQNRGIKYIALKREKTLQTQGLKVKLACGVSLGFLYCRTTPTNSDIDKICKEFEDCSCLMGDLNLSHRIEEHRQKLKKLCKDSKESILHEITRSISNNQLDYVLTNAKVKENCFTTSFYNFISDHKSITIRIGLFGNTFSSAMKEKLFFNKELHLKQKITLNNQEVEEPMLIASTDLSDSNSSVSEASFKRRFLNRDGTKCWMNSCLQMVLNAVDRVEDTRSFVSDLGCQFVMLKDSNSSSLNPKSIIDIIMEIEDLRIAKRLSEITECQYEQSQIDQMTRNIIRYDLSEGQQCVRDLLLCLQANSESWPDICSLFEFKLKHSTICLNCSYSHVTQTSEMYLELQVSSGMSNLNELVEEYLNQSELVTLKCEDGCGKVVQKEKRTQLSSCIASKYIIVVLQRGIQTPHGFRVVRNRLTSTGELFIR